MDFKGLMSKAGKAFGEEVDKKAKEMILMFGPVWNTY